MGHGDAGEMGSKWMKKGDSPTLYPAVMRGLCRLISKFAQASTLSME